MNGDGHECPGEIRGLVPLDGEVLKRMHEPLSQEVKDLIAVLLRHACTKHFTTAEMAAVMTEARDFFAEVHRQRDTGE